MNDPSVILVFCRIQSFVLFSRNDIPNIALSIALQDTLNCCIVLYTHKFAQLNFCNVIFFNSNLRLHFLNRKIPQENVHIQIFAYVLFVCSLISTSFVAKFRKNVDDLNAKDIYIDMQRQPRAEFR